MPVLKRSEAVTLTNDNGSWNLTIDDAMLTSKTTFNVHVVNRSDPRNYRLIKTKKNNYQMV